MSVSTTAMWFYNGAKFIFFCPFLIQDMSKPNVLLRSSIV